MEYFFNYSASILITNRDKRFDHTILVFFFKILYSFSTKIDIEEKFS